MIPMVTTIHVEHETKQILETLKRKESLPSINSLILKLVSDTERAVPKSLFGIDKNKKIKVSKTEAHEI